MEEDYELPDEFRPYFEDYPTTVDHCTEDFHVPKLMTYTPPSTYLLWCDCNERSNVQMTKRDAHRYPLPLVFESAEERHQWEREMKEER